MFSFHSRCACTAIITLFAVSGLAHATPISATFNGILEAQPVDDYYSMFYGTPDFRFDGASYEFTIHGDTDTAANYTTSYRGSSQQYDFSRFDVTVDASIIQGGETLQFMGQAAQITFYNFLSSSPWGDLISFSLGGQDDDGNYLSYGVQQVNQAATSVIWQDDGIVTSLSTLVDPNFDPNDVARGFLRDSSDSSAEYLTGPLNAGPAPAISAVPVPAGVLLMLTGIGAFGMIPRRKSSQQVTYL